MLKCALHKNFKLSPASSRALEPYYDIVRYDVKDAFDQAVDVWVGGPPKVLPKSLKWIQLQAVGFDGLDLKSLHDNNITLTNGSGTSSAPIAEYVVGAILYHYKKFGHYTQLQLTQTWNRKPIGKEVSGSKVAVLGTGHIGADIAKRLIPFGVHITGYNSNGRLVEPFDACAPLSSLASTIADFDIVILALPLNAFTKHIVDGTIIKTMKDNALLINVGRGALIAQKDLEALLDTHLGGVVLDVFETEPLEEGNPLWSHPKAFITPHISYASQFNEEKLESLIVENLVRYTRGESLLNIVSTQ